MNTRYLLMRWQAPAPEAALWYDVIQLICIFVLSLKKKLQCDATSGWQSAPVHGGIVCRIVCRLHSF